MKDINEIKFERLSDTDMKNIKGVWCFWGKERILIGYGDDAYYETYQYVLGIDVWISESKDD